MGDTVMKLWYDIITGNHTPGINHNLKNPKRILTMAQIFDLVSKHLEIIAHALDYYSGGGSLLRRLVRRHLVWSFAIAYFPYGDPQYLQLHQVFTRMVRAISYSISVQELDVDYLKNKICNFYELEQIMTSFDFLKHIQAQLKEFKQNLTRFDSYTLHMVSLHDINTLTKRLTKANKIFKQMQIHFDTHLSSTQLIEIQDLNTYIWDALYYVRMAIQDKDSIYLELINTIQSHCN